jgi:hypothetical protein
MQQLDSVFVKERATGKYVHFQPETRSYYTREGKVGACVFKPDIVHQFIAQVLGAADQYQTESLPAPVRVKRDTERAAYAEIRAQGYQG